MGMKFRFPKQLLLFALLVSSISAHIELDYPLGGETFVMGDTIRIEWHVIIPHEQQNWDINFTPDGGGNWIPIVEDIPVSQLSFEWIIDQDPTEHGRINVIQDNVGYDYADWSDDFTILADPASRDEREGFVSHFKLERNYPNPFNPSTRITYQVPRNSMASIVILDLNGRLIATLADHRHAGGVYSITWNGMDDSGASVPGGIYFYQLRSGASIQTNKMIFLK